MLPQPGEEAASAILKKIAHSTRTLRSAVGLGENPSHWSDPAVSDPDTPPEDGEGGHSYD
jgi:hypothetical protein